MDDLLEKAESIADLIRSQNWKNGGCLRIDRDDAINAVKQLVRAAFAAGEEKGVRGNADRMMKAFDNADAKRATLTSA